MISIAIEWRNLTVSVNGGPPTVEGQEGVRCGESRGRCVRGRRTLWRGVGADEPDLSLNSRLPDYREHSIVMEYVNTGGVMDRCRD